MFDDIFDLLWDEKDDIFKLIDKKHRTRDLVLYMLDRTQQIFTWENLPDTIPQHNLEYLLQVCGNACITEVSEIPDGRGDAGLYAFFGGLGGMLNAYYEPTIYTVANPYLEFNKELTIGVDCVRARNDKYSQGLIPMFCKYGAMMNENEISLNMLSINYRIDNLISADDDRTYESAKQYLNDIVCGKFGAISSTEFFDGIKNDKVGGNGKQIKDLIEYEQYLKASWYNEIGLNSNYNMKRERMVAAEAELTDDALIPLVDNMYEWRLKACEDIKELYGDKYNLDGLTVKLNQIWDLDNMYIDIPKTEEKETPEDDEVDISNGISDNTDNSGDNDISENEINETEENDNEFSECSEESTDSANVEININIDNVETLETETTEEKENDDDDVFEENPEND